MDYIAHISDDGREQSVKAHLEEAAKLAEKYATEPFKKFAYFIGMLHDVGKYSDEFQKHIRGALNKVEHAVCGAKELPIEFSDNELRYMAQYCIVGHHSGLPDGGTDVDRDDCATLSGRLKRKVPNYSTYKKEIEIEVPKTDEFAMLFSELNKIADRNKRKREKIELFAFLTKYMFSCLTDADFIDTEAFCKVNVNRGMEGDFKVALELVNAKISTLKQDTDVRKARSQLQAQAIANSEGNEEISILNMPTGSGKTLCSIKLALEKAIREGKKRMIYVIPYTSIIEQTANTFTDIFKEVLPVLQHHSNFCFDKRELATDEEKDNERKRESDEDISDKTAEKLRQTCENWDAPLVVTTNVQFFQSLYHYKGSRLRKLHNLADSIIIFDEIHTIPVDYLQPCLRGIGYVTKLLNSKAIFLSATMPDYSELFAKYMPNNSVCNLINDKSLFDAFKKCTFDNMGATTYENIAKKAQDYNSSLIIVNSRKAAKLVYGLVCGPKYHLSTYMTPKHRSEVIAEIKEKLKNKKKITVVSTSLVEAGVDFDFNAVFRELAGLESILQAAGRCNRDGVYDNGYMFIFEACNLEDEVLATYHDDLKARVNITKSILQTCSDITTPESITEYFRKVFDFNNDKIEENSISKNMQNRVVKAIPFRTYAEEFEYIKQDTIGVVIENCDEAQNLTERLRKGDRSVIRKLQRHSVPLYMYEINKLVKYGICDDVQGVLLLKNSSYYDEKTGLSLEKTQDIII